MTTAPIPENVEPLAVWDARESDWEYGFGALRVQQGRWLKKNIGDPRIIYRVEFCAGPPRAIVHRYGVNEDGCKYNDPATGEPATDRPVMVALDELPPKHLMGDAS